MKKNKKLVIFGDSAFAEIAYEYFTFDSDYEVVAFTVSKEFLKKEKLFDLPIVAFEDVEALYPSSEHEMHVALVYNSLNRNRKKFYDLAKLMGYTMANYISSNSFVWKNVEMGDNCFIFEDNTIQPFVKIGSNNVFWSGNHIGHHSNIGSNNFFSSHVVVSGFCEIGNLNFFGVNSTVGNNLKIGNDCFIGAAANIVKELGDGSFVKGLIAPKEEITTWEKFKVEKI